MPEPESSFGVSRTRGSLFLMAARGLNAAFNVVSVPIYLVVLGKNGYAAIVYALAIQGLMNLSDIGTGEIVQRQMSIAIGKKDEAEVRALNRDQVAINFATGLLMVLIGVLCGVFLSLEDTGVGLTESFFIFAALGLQSAMYRLNQSVATVLYAYQRFDGISISSALGGITTTLVAVAAIYLTGRPWTYVAAMLVGEAVIFAVLYSSVKRTGHWTKLTLRFDMARLKPILRLCAIDYPNRAANIFTLMGDKFVLGMANAKLGLVDYRNASRVPDALRDMFQPLAATSLPKLSRDFGRSKAAFQNSTLETGRMVFFASAVAVIAPTGFADPLLKLWLGVYSPLGGADVLVLIAAYQALQIYLSVMGFAFFAAAKRGLFIPLTMTNAIGTALFTLPVFNAFGIVGLGLLKFGLGAVQVIGLWLLLLALGLERAAIVRHIAQILAIVGVCAAVVAAGRYLSDQPLVAQSPIWFLAFAPAAMVLALGLCLALKIGELPSSLANRLPGRKGTPRSNGDA